jgi:hypothetical protein
MCVRKTPLAEVFYFLPDNGARKEAATFVMAPRKEAAGAKLTRNRRSLCVVNNQLVGNPKRKV